jgi:hypothetical protein
MWRSLWTPSFPRVGNSLQSGQLHQLWFLSCVSVVVYSEALLPKAAHWLRSKSDKASSSQKSSNANAIAILQLFGHCLVSNLSNGSVTVHTDSSAQFQLYSNFCPFALLAVRRAQYLLTRGPKGCKNQPLGGLTSGESVGTRHQVELT